MKRLQVILEPSNRPSIIRKDAERLGEVVNMVATLNLKNLGCDLGVPNDGVSRFIRTSPEFAGALRNVARKSDKWLHRYRSFALGDQGDTILLEIIPIPVSSNV